MAALTLCGTLAFYTNCSPTSTNSAGPENIGSGNPDDPTPVVPVKKGDRILFAKYAGTEVKINGVEHLILGEEEILGVLE